MPTPHAWIIVDMGAVIWTWHCHLIVPHPSLGTYIGIRLPNFAARVSSHQHCKPMSRFLSCQRVALLPHKFQDAPSCWCASRLLRHQTAFSQEIPPRLRLAVSTAEPRLRLRRNLSLLVPVLSLSLSSYTYALCVCRRLLAWTTEHGHFLL